MTKEIERDVDEILLTEDVIQAKVRELAVQVSRDYQEEDLHLVAVLKGALIFLSDFSRALSIQATLDFMVVSSYEGLGNAGEVRILKDLSHSIRGRHVLLVEDIIDGGSTLSTVWKTLRIREPASLKVCTLLNKAGKRKVEVTPDYNGFVIPNRFVAGYGLDYHERYRDLPYIATLRKEVYEHF